MKIFTEYFKDRTVAFYISLGFAMMSVVVAIVYGAAVLGLDDGISVAPVIMMIIGALAVPALALIRLTRVGLGVMGVLDFFSVVVFAVTVYEYPISQAMVVSNAMEIEGMASIIAVAVFMLICFVAANVLAWIRQDKKRPAPSADGAAAAAEVKR